MMAATDRIFATPDISRYIIGRAGSNLSEVICLDRRERATPLRTGIAENFVRARLISDLEQWTLIPK